MVGLFTELKMNSAQQIIETYGATCEDFFRGLLVGNSGQTYCRLYLDLNDHSLFESCEPSCNTWLHRDDGSLVEIYAHNSYGMGLTDDEMEHLREAGVSDFGYAEWLDAVEDGIETALDWWQRRNAEIVERED